MPVPRDSFSAIDGNRLRGTLTKHHAADTVVGVVWWDYLALLSGHTATVITDSSWLVAAPEDTSIVLDDDWLSANIAGVSINGGLAGEVAVLENRVILSDESSAVFSITATIE